MDNHIFQRDNYGKHTVSMAMFNSQLFVITRGYNFLNYGQWESPMFFQSLLGKIQNITIILYHPDSTDPGSFKSMIRIDKIDEDIVYTSFTLLGFEHPQILLKPGRCKANLLTDLGPKLRSAGGVCNSFLQDSWVDQDRLEWGQQIPTVRNSLDLSWQ